MSIYKLTATARTPYTYWIRWIWTLRQKELWNLNPCSGVQVSRGCIVGTEEIQEQHDVWVGWPQIGSWYHYDHSIYTSNFTDSVTLKYLSCTYTCAHCYVFLFLKDNHCMQIKVVLLVKWPLFSTCTVCCTAANVYMYIPLVCIIQWMQTVNRCQCFWNLHLRNLTLACVYCTRCFVAVWNVCIYNPILIYNASKDGDTGKLPN